MERAATSHNRAGSASPPVDESGFQLAGLALRAPATLGTFSRRCSTCIFVALVFATQNPYLGWHRTLVCNVVNTERYAKWELEIGKIIINPIEKINLWGKIK